ncbi:lysozyme [Novosphingobium resinovorum]|uniref:lysozyme n=1 Tax=Novosphingobium TaxID=165696 RepID=UPI001B3CA1A5|nr:MULTISPECIES: lysozyme [Novosphingobium]MBF7010284.1 lysozyme [Novosphingobium sp. HR1a]WJM28294.1 lysozyme [Novosphingobium resinovorum]
MNRKPIFDAVRKMLDRSFTQAEVNALDKAIDLSTGGLTASLAPEPVSSPATAVAATGRVLGAAGAKLIKKWEGCAKRQANGTFAAYPDPGSVDGKPWTIGWGSTGPDVRKGVVWTQAQCDARFDVDMVDYVKEVAAFIGSAATSQNQFDALVSFHYNTGKITSSSLGKLHKAGDFAGAQAQFGKWIYNDGKPMTGLKNRRADEAKLYGTA